MCIRTLVLWTWTGSTINLKVSLIWISRGNVSLKKIYTNNNNEIKNGIALLLVSTSSLISLIRISSVHSIFNTEGEWEALSHLTNQRDSLLTPGFLITWISSIKFEYFTLHVAFLQTNPKFWLNYTIVLQANTAIKIGMDEPTYINLVMFKWTFKQFSKRSRQDPLVGSHHGQLRENVNFRRSKRCNEEVLYFFWRNTKYTFFFLS